MAEPIEMRFGVLTWNHMLDGGPDYPHAKGKFWRGKLYLHGKWLPKEQDEQFFYNRIRALEKCPTKCISVAGNYAEKWQNMMYVLVLWLTVFSLRIFWMPLVHVVVTVYKYCQCIEVSKIKHILFNNFPQSAQWLNTVQATDVHKVQLSVGPMVDKLVLINNYIMCTLWVLNQAVTVGGI